jgi:hypothetical protein
MYYRALVSVPSLVRAWVDACKDRTLSNAVTSYTSQHFSPVIIAAELAAVRSPGTLAELADDSFSAKVLAAAHEVTASYTVDEQALELTLKLPSDWPLHTIEIRDHRRIGVAEDRWRAWILGVQQVIWSSARFFSCLPYATSNVHGRTARSWTGSRFSRRTFHCTLRGWWSARFATRASLLKDPSGMPHR